MPTPRIDLVDLEIDSVDFVDQGDNPEAHILMVKRASNDTRKDDMSNLLKSRDGVLALASKTAEQVQARTPGMSIAAARAEVWKSHPQLRDAFEAAPDEQTQQAEAVTKAGDVLAAHAGVVSELRKSAPELTEAGAKARAWELRPDLRQRYDQALGF